MIIPKITEKSLSLAKNKQYSFVVDRNATKYQIKKMIEDFFKVKVTSVKTQNQKGKVKKKGKMRKNTQLPNTKIARISLSKKDKIDLFEVAEKEESKK